MASARFAWGIDIGNRALKAVKLVREGDALRVDDFELIEHEQVLSNAGDNREQLVQTALANFVQRHPMKGGVVAIGVAGQSSFARFIKLPPVEEKKIPEIVKFEAIQQIPFPLDDVEWSYQLFRNPESPDVEVGIFAMRKDLVQRHIQFFTDFDLNVQLVQMNPLAVYNAVHFDQRLSGTTMIIDLGAENTDLIICDNDSVWMRSIPIGGNNFTETLVKAFKLPFIKAEDLKRNAATSKYARQIFQAMRPVFADLVAEIQRSVGFYASVHRDSRIKQIIALGGTFRLPGLQKYLQQNLSLNVERLDNISAGAPADPKQAATFNENLLSVVSAYGLAVQAMGEGKITSSLLPSSIRREKAWKQKTPIFAAAAASFCIGTGIALGGYFLQKIKFEAAADTRNDIQRVLGEAQTLDSQWKSQIEDAGATDRTTITNVQSLVQYRDLWRNLLRDIESSIPPPQPEIAQGIKENNPALYKDKIPRSDRNQIIIRNITTAYSGNIGQLVTGPDSDLKKYANDGALPSMPNAPAAEVNVDEVDPAGGGAAAGNSMGGGGNMNDTANDPNAGAAGSNLIPGLGGPQTGMRGFLITIKGESPSANAPTLIETSLCAALRKIGPTATVPKMYAVRKAVAISASQIDRDQNLKNQMKQAYTEMVRTRPAQPAQPPPGALPGTPAAAPQVPTEDVAPYLDRLTGEDVRNDWEFTVVAVVLLDPPIPAAAAPGAPGAAAPAAPAK